VQRTCKLCGKVFELDYSFGRPREYCFSCEPSGWKVVLRPHRVKLRRLRPIGPRMPKGIGDATLARAQFYDRVRVTVEESRSSPAIDVRLIPHRRRRQPMRAARDTMIPSGPRT
jgi:hypothetical protein